jgi:hypothetical protein
MTTVAIPDWNAQGVIPPLYSHDSTSAERSPYRVSLTDLVLRFGTTPQRRTILDGLLRFRAALHQAGLSNGFQWVDGSFLERIELVESRDPRDIDVVTFFRLPDGHTQTSLIDAHPGLFDPRETKMRFRVDGYFVDLFSAAPEALIQKATYWYSLWSHRRDSLWKGYLQVDLAQPDDAAATASLDAMGREGNAS